MDEAILDKLFRLLDNDEVSATYAEQQWVLLPALLPAEPIPAFLNEIAMGPAKRVAHRFRGRLEWRTEHDLGPTSAMGSILRGPRLRHLAETIYGKPLMSPPVAWAQSYAIGERTPWHRDVCDLHLVVCLQCTRARTGGELLLRLDDGVATLSLGAGDAVLFDAAAITHATRPLRTQGSHVPLPRVSATVRYSSTAAAEG